MQVIAEVQFQLFLLWYTLEVSTWRQHRDRMMTTTVGVQVVMTLDSASPLSNLLRIEAASQRRFPQPLIRGEKDAGLRGVSAPLQRRR